MLNYSNAIIATSQERYLGIFPEDKGDLGFSWPYEVTQTAARVDEELSFFDDMLSCISQQFNVQKECVAAGGMSAGGLWTGQLASHRSQYLSSILVMSGGFVVRVSRSREQASSSTSIALSGRNRSAMYREDRSTDAAMAESVMRTRG